MSETTDGTDLPESNVFAKPWPLDLGLPGFTAVDHADIEPAIRAGMAAERREWEAIATNEDAPTIANTVDALERSGELLERALTVLDALTSATDCPDLDELEEALAPELAAHSDAYHLDSRLYRRFKVLDELVAQAPEGQCARDADGTVTFVTPAACMASVTRTEKRILSALTRALISLSTCVSASSRPTPLRSNSSTVRRMRREVSASMTVPSASRAACPSGAWATSSSRTLKRR